MSIMVIDKMPLFKRNLYSVMDDALKEGARDVLIKAKAKAPYRKGGLRGDTDITTPKPLSKRISFGIEYARFQEFGGDGKRQVRKYTTSGTGAHYLKTSGDDIGKSLVSTFRKHGIRARV